MDHAVVPRTKKVPYNLNISTDGISGGEESDESDYGDVPTPQLTPVPTAVAGGGGGDTAASVTVVTVALGVTLEDGEASNARQIPRGRGRKQRPGLTISGDDEQQQQQQQVEGEKQQQQQQAEGEKQQQVAEEEEQQQQQAGKEQQQQVGEKGYEEEEKKEAGGEGGEGAGKTTTMSKTQTASSAQTVTMFSSATTTTPMAKTTERTTPECRRDGHPEETSPEASTSATERVRDGSDDVKGAGSGGKREGDASGVSEPEDEIPATPGFEANGAFEPPADPPTVEQCEGEARDSVSSLSSCRNGSGGSETDVDVPEVSEQGSTEVGLEAGAAVGVTVEAAAAAVSGTPTEVARAPERDSGAGVQEEKSGTTGPAEPRQLDGVSSGSSLGSEGGTFAERIGSFDAAIATAEAAAAAATTASATASAASAAAAAAASTAARAAAAAVAAEKMSSESFSPEGADGGKEGGGGGGGGQGGTVGGGATTSSLPPRIPSSSREFPNGHKEGCPEARSGAGSSQQQQHQDQDQDDTSKQAGGGDGAPQENRAGPTTAGGESLTAKSDAAEGEGELVERRPSTLYVSECTVVDTQGHQHCLSRLPLRLEE